MILLTGVTGKTGGAVARALIDKGVTFRALVRDADKAAALKEAGVELVVGDMADREAVAVALAGIEKAALILPNSKEQREMELQFVDLAAAAGVRHLVKLSSLEARPDAKTPIPQLHWAVEEHIRASGMGWTMIRPNFFMDNLLPAGRTIKSDGNFALPMGEGIVCPMACSDIGAAIAEVLTGQGHEGRSYEISGPEQMTFHDIAAQFSEVLGKPVEYVDADPVAYRERVGPFLSSDWHADAVAELFAEIRANVLVPTVNDTFKKLVGREPVTFRQFVQAHIAAFR